MSNYYKPGDRGRRSIRLRGFDYSQNAAYFVTLVTKNRQRFFGTIEDGEMMQSEAGVIAHNTWLAIPEYFPFVVLDEFIVMPDHMHGLLLFDKDLSQLEHSALHPQSRTLGSVVRGYKIRVTQRLRDTLGVSTIWQRDYYDIIVRSAEAMYRIRNYIRNNPRKGG